MSQKIQIIKYAPPPPELPVFGKDPVQEVSYFGRTNYVAALEEKKFIFGIKREDRRRHIYMIGKSGTGKTKLMELLIRQDIAYGKGVCLIDPHGELVDSILEFIPEERVEDVVLIDPAADRPVAFNPLANVAPGLRHHLAQSFIDVMARHFGTTWSPHLEHIFRFVCLALLDYPGATMRGMISILTDDEYRTKVAETVQDEMVKRFWANEFPEWKEKFAAEAVIPLVNKLNHLLADPLLRGIFEQGEDRIDLGRFIEEKKIVLVNLAKGRLGEESASFFGSVLIAKMKQAGIARASTRNENKEDFYVYVDEFNTLVTQAFSSIISDARKYGICLTLSNQYLGQLPSEVQSALLGSFGSLIVFRVSGEDAARLKPEMAPIFEVKDMINLGTREFYIKMIIEGDSYDPFSAETLKVLPAPHSSLRDKALKNSLEKYTLS